MQEAYTAALKIKKKLKRKKIFLQEAYTAALQVLIAYVSLLRRC